MAVKLIEIAAIAACAALCVPALMMGMAGLGLFPKFRWRAPRENQDE